MTPEEISRVEDIVNKEIAADLQVVTEVMSLDEAKKEVLYNESYRIKI